MHSQNSVYVAPNMLHLHFFLQLQVTSYVSGSAMIHLLDLLGINNESTDFQPNSTGFKLVSGADIRFEQIKTT